MPARPRPLAQRRRRRASSALAGPGGRRHDPVPLRELLCPRLLSLFHHVQVQRPVSAGRARGGEGAGPGPTPHRPLLQVRVQRLLEMCPGRGHLPLCAAMQGEGLRDSTCLASRHSRPQGPGSAAVALHGTTLETKLRDCARIP